MRKKTLLAQRLDAASGKLVGQAVPLGPEFPSNVGLPILLPRPKLLPVV